MVTSKKITIDDLGAMVARGFKQMDERFNELDSRLSGRIDGLELKMDNGFKSLQSQLDSARLDYTPRREHSLLVARVKKVERKVGIVPH